MHLQIFYTVDILKKGYKDKILYQFYALPQKLKLDPLPSMKKIAGKEKSWYKILMLCIQTLFKRGKAERDKHAKHERYAPTAIVPEHRLYGPIILLFRGDKGECEKPMHSLDICI